MIIGISGTIGSGKTTISKYLKKKYNFVEYAFADPIKKFAIDIGFKHKEVYGTQDEKLAINVWWGVSGRTFMQKFGTELCRDIMPKIIPNMNIKNGNIWINIFKNYIHENKNKNFVISDVRFLNEFNAIKDKNGILIKIIRPHIHPEKKHISDLNIKSTYDFVIVNDGTKKALFEKLDKICNLTFK